MIEKISKTDEIEKKFSQAGKIMVLDRPQDMAAIVAMNEQLEADRRDYQAKERESQINAYKVILKG